MLELRLMGSTPSLPLLQGPLKPEYELLQNRTIWSRNGTLTSNTIPGQSWPGINQNKRVFPTSQIFNFTVYPIKGAYFLGRSVLPLSRGLSQRIISPVDST